MKYDNLKDEMHYYLNNGIVQDIFQCRRSYSLLMTVGKNGPRLGSSVYLDFFYSLQSILSDHFVLHATKLFERPKSRYNTISIPFILEFINKNVRELKIIEKSLVCQHLSTLGILDQNTFSLPSIELNKLIVDYFENEILMIDNSNVLQRLRVLRDKRIAHREAFDISDIPDSPFSEAFELIKFAQNVAIVFGAAYTSNIYGFVNGLFYLGDDAGRSSVSLEKVFKSLINDIEAG